MTKIREYGMAFLALTAVLLGLTSLLTTGAESIHIAMVASLIALSSVLLTIFFITREEERIEKKVKYIRQKERDIAHEEKKIEEEESERRGRDTANR